MRRTGQFVGAALAVVGIVAAAQADTPGRHPAYLRALSDMRAARWLLQRQTGDAFVSAHEANAVHYIDRAIGEIKRAAIDDGKDLNFQPNIDVPGVHAGRLHRARDILRQARADVDQPEDDRSAWGLKQRALEAIDLGLRETNTAMSEIEHHP